MGRRDVIVPAVDVTEQIRGVDLTRPVAVRRSTDHVHLDLTPAMAEQLARIIAVGVTAAAGDLDGNERRWDQTAAELLGAQNLTYVHFAGTAR